MKSKTCLILLAGLTVLLLASSIGVTGSSFIDQENSSGNTLYTVTNWYAPAWHYRKPITISNSGEALNDYQVKATINTQALNSAGKMQPDGDDIRFTQSDGTTEIPYWIESGINTTSTVIWVKVPSIHPYTLTTIYMYYGNPDAAPASDSTATFVFYDDFDDGSLSSKWTAALGIDSAKWTFSNPSNYTYDGAKIEVGASYAQLLENSSPVWWDTSYACRRQINVQNNTASALPSGYSVKLTLDHASLFAAGKAQVGGKDVRMVYWNGSSNVELDRVAETSWNTSSTEIWFKTQADITGSGSDNNYYVYYGNPSAVNPPADRSNVYLWYDDFSTDTLANYDKAKWVDVHGGPSKYVTPSYDAANQMVSFDTGDNHASDMYPIGLTVADFLMEVEFLADTRYPRDATIALVARLENPGTSSTHYYLDFSHGRTDRFLDIFLGKYDSPGITVDSWTNGERSNTVYSEASDYYWSFSQFHTFRYALFGNTQKFWWNKESSEVPDITVNDSTHTSPGRLGLAPAQVRGWWDNFKVRRYIEPEPSVSSAAEEVPSYPSDTLTIQPVTGQPYTELLAFDETLGPANEGKVRYQVSNNGTSWYYHNGTNWVAASGLAQTNTAAEVNTNISSFDDEVGTGNIYFKAFLSSDGAQQVQLDQISIEMGSFWSRATDQKRSGMYSLKAGVTGDSNMYTLATGVDEADVLFDAWWYCTTTTPVICQSIRASSAEPLNDYHIHWEGQWNIAEMPWDSLNSAIESPRQNTWFNLNLLMWCNWNPLYSVAGSLPQNTWFKMTVIMQGTSLKVLKDEVQISPVSGWFDVGTKYASGTIGFRAWRTSSNWWIDDVKVRKYASPEPSVTERGEEEYE